MSARAGAADAAGPNPLDGLYAFVRTHLAVANAIVLASGTVVAILDFLAPRLSVLPAVVYTGTAAVLALMVLAAVAPRAAAGALALAGLRVAGTESAPAPLWRRPAWQASVAILAFVTAAGFASVAKASQGGLIASALPAAKEWQARLLSLDARVAQVGAGVDQANAKLDRVVAAIDPHVAADRCPDLECAIQGGASSATVRRLFERGARVPGNPINNGELLRMAAISRGAGRLETIELLFQHGVPRESRFLALYHSPGEVSREGLRWAAEVEARAHARRDSPSKFDASGDEELAVWNAAQGCFLRTSGGVTLLELAGLLGDGDLAARLIAGGSKLPARPLACSMRGMGGAGGARVRIDPGTGRVLGVEALPA